jgi:hypothetical protein
VYLPVALAEALPRTPLLRKSVRYSRSAPATHASSPGRTPQRTMGRYGKTLATSTHATASATASCPPCVPTRPSLDLLPLARAYRLRRRSIKLRITPQPATLGSGLFRTIVDFTFLDFLMPMRRAEGTVAP